MGADQLVHPVPALARLGEQVLVVQSLQGAAGAGQDSAIQGGSGEGVDAVPGCTPSRRNSRCCLGGPGPHRTS